MTDSPSSVMLTYLTLLCVFVVSSTIGSSGTTYSISRIIEYAENRQDNIETGQLQRSQSKLSALWELDFMVGCTTGRGFAEALYDYAWYGCYCGFGGRGVPVDETDRCCMIHDRCYDDATRSRACRPQPDEYIIPYRRHYQMTNCQTPDARITCDSADSYPWWYPMKHCAASICLCDAAVAECLGRSTMNPGNVFYPKRTCRSGIAPTMNVATRVTQGTPQSTFATDFITELFDLTTTSASVTSGGTTSNNEARNDGSDDVIGDVISDEVEDDTRKYSKLRFDAKLAAYKRKHFPTYFNDHDDTVDW